MPSASKWPGRAGPLYHLRAVWSGLRCPAQILPADRQRAQALAGGGKDRVGHRGLDHSRARLADTTPSLAGCGGDVNFRLRCVFVAYHRVGVEVALLDAAVL